MHRRVDVDDRERVARRPPVRLVQAGAEHRPAGAMRCAGRRTPGELGHHQPGARTGSANSAITRAPPPGVDLQGRSAAARPATAPAPAAGRRAPGARRRPGGSPAGAGRPRRRGAGRPGRPSRRRPRPAGRPRRRSRCRGGTVLGQGGVGPRARRTVRAGDVVRGHPRVPDDEDGLGVREEPVEAPGWLRGQRRTVPTVKHVRGRSRRQTALRMRRSLVLLSLWWSLRGLVAPPRARPPT